MSITNWITPFATPLPLLQTLNLQGIAESSLVKMRIFPYTATLYDDGITQINAPVWAYERTASPKSPTRSWLGPMIMASSGRKLQFDWTHDVISVIASTQQPLSIVEELEPATGDPVPQNLLGVSPGAMVKKHPLPFFSTHLHGGHTSPNYDGWPEHMLLPGQTRRVQYDNKERATLHWYHDHAMHATRHTVYAGLAGVYVIRDEIERSLALPNGTDELALIIQDRNITLNPTQPLPKGQVQTQLLHKVQTDVMEFFGPLNLVNGAIWPRKSVRPKLYRVRLLVGANARTYALRFVTGQATVGPWVDADIDVWQIGSDGGLMDVPRQILPEGAATQGRYPMVMMPAERMDLLIDFSRAAGQQVMLVNAAAAPFGGTLIPLNDTEFPPTNPDLDADPVTGEIRRNPYPQIMRFDVASGTATSANGTLTQTLARFTPSNVLQPRPAKTPPVKVRTIALFEKDMGINHFGTPEEGPLGAMLTTMELVPEADLLPANGSALTTGTVTMPYQALHAKRVVIINGERFRVCAERFMDPVNFEVTLGSTERWRFINLSPDSHPMHIHLVQFQKFAETPVSNVTGSGVASTGDTVAGVVNLSFITGTDVDVALLTASNALLDEPLKDTIRVDPMTMVEVVAKFDDYLGRYLYHCHLLEHEDHDMMRQFVVVRPDMHDIMGVHMHPAHSSSVGK